MPVNEVSGNLKPSSKHKTKSKKTANEKEAKAVTQSSENKASEGTTSTSVNNQKAASLEWFTSEIQLMMYGFGDCKNPLLESAQLVEEIVHQQMNSLLIQAAEVAATRNARFIGLEDIVFLMRKDKVKLSRLIHYLTVKDTKAAIVKSSGLEDDDMVDAEGGGGTDQKMQPPRLKRAKLCQDFLNSISILGGIMSKYDEDVVDEVKVERKIRCDLQSSSMDQNQYLEYCEARRTSFARKYRSTKFRDWLLKDNLTDIKPNAIALEIFNYLAYETVAQIVDLALLVKQDAQSHPGDPFSRSYPSVIYNPEYPNILISHSLKQCTSARPDSPSQSSVSPPPSPTSQDRNSQHVTTAGNQTSNSNKPKPKKRRKSEGKISLDLSLSGSRCIQPSDIREAVRRYWRPMGPMMLFSKLHNSHLATRLMCC